MIEIVKRYVCESCGKQEFVQPDSEAAEWMTTEIGDLCPVCSRAWSNYKESFINRMRKDNGKPLYQHALNPVHQHAQ